MEVQPLEYNLNHINSFTHPIEFVEWCDNENFISIYGHKCDSVVCDNEEDMILELYNSSPDGVTLRCNNPNCRNRKSIRIGTWFSQSHLSLKIQLSLIIKFICQDSGSATARELNLSVSTVYTYFQRCRDAYSNIILENPIEFNEEEDGNEYEADEMMLNHVLISSHPRIFANFIWIAGVISRESKKLKCYIIPDRSKDNLVDRHLGHYVPADCYLYTDSWSGYNGLDQYDILHHTVNHSADEFYREEDLGNGVVIQIHTNTIEGTWRVLRRALSNRARRTLSLIRIYLREFEYHHSGRSLFQPFKVVEEEI